MVYISLLIAIWACVCPGRGAGLVGGYRRSLASASCNRLTPPLLISHHLTLYYIGNDAQLSAWAPYGGSLSMILLHESGAAVPVAFFAFFSHPVV